MRDPPTCHPHGLGLLPRSQAGSPQGWALREVGQQLGDKVARCSGLEGTLPLSPAIAAQASVQYSFHSPLSH